jgi:hypothetical protein
LIKGSLGKKGVALVGQTREVILAEKLIDSLIVSGGIVNPIVSGGPFEPLGGMRPALVQTLQILDLPIQIHVIEVPRGLDLG